MSLRRHRVLWPRLLLCIGLLAALVRGQTFTGAVVGRVFDSQQAVMVNTAVTLRSVERAFEWHTTTNMEGEYVFQLVPPGKFTVQAQAGGFAVTKINVEVVVATPVRADLVLGVQPSQQLINVFGENGDAESL
jgi:hypothetical protein